MNPDNLDPRVRAANKANNRRRHRDPLKAFGYFFATAAITGLIIFGSLLFVLIHFLAKVW